MSLVIYRGGAFPYQLPICISAVPYLRTGYSAQTGLPHQGDDHLELGRGSVRGRSPRPTEVSRPALLSETARACVGAVSSMRRASAVSRAMLQHDVGPWADLGFFSEGGAAGPEGRHF